jgi:hypothetical protein
VYQEYFPNDKGQSGNHTCLRLEPIFIKRRELLLSRVVSQLRRWVAAFPPPRLGFDTKSGHVEFVVDRVALGHVFPKYFGLACQFSSHRLLHTHLSSGAAPIGRTVASVPSGLSFNPPHELIIIIIIIILIIIIIIINNDNNKSNNNNFYANYLFRG